MLQIILKKGEKKYLYFTLTDKYSKEKIDISNASSVSIQIQRYYPIEESTVRVDSTCEIYSLTNSQVRWLTDETLPVGKYWGEIEIWETGGYVSKSEDMKIEILEELPKT